MHGQNHIKFVCSDSFWGGTQTWSDIINTLRLVWWPLSQVEYCIRQAYWTYGPRVGMLSPRGTGLLVRTLSFLEFLFHHYFNCEFLKLWSKILSSTTDLFSSATPTRDGATHAARGTGEAHAFCSTGLGSFWAYTLRWHSWLRHCATSRKVSLVRFSVVSLKFFIDIILPAAL